MADLSGITAVRPTRTTQLRIVDCGATIAPGQSMAKSGDTYVLADANASAVLAAAEGVCMTPGVSGGQCVMAFGGPIILVGATMTKGRAYVVSDTAGGIMPESDLSAGEWHTGLGVADSATQLTLRVNATGVQV